MVIKERFELISGTNGNIYNIIPIRKPTLDGFMIPKEESFHVKNMSEVYQKTRPDLAFLKKDIDDTIVIKVKEYPLPGFVTKDNISVINLSVLPSEFVTDFTPQDVYSMFVYSTLLNRYIINRKSFDINIADFVSEFIILSMMKLFGKKYGLTGSYMKLIPNMQLLCSLYVHTGMFGLPLENKLITKISNKYYSDASNIRIPDNINTTIGFLKSLKNNNIIPISENKFSTTIINMAGINSLVMFEDVSRLFATIAASSISGTTVFSKYWKKMNPKLYDKLLYFALLKAQK